MEVEVKEEEEEEEEDDDEGMVREVRTMGVGEKKKTETK